MCPAPHRIRLECDGVKITLSPGSYIIGRAGEAAVRVESPAVSRYHARILVDDATAMVEDLDSKNGTFVGNTRINRPTPLADGDTISLGRSTARLLVVIDRGSAEIERSKDHSSEATVNG
jgi:pSer/pThr/pTyr-binding forkhead associated (FHA) protein